MNSVIGLFRPVPSKLWRRPPWRRLAPLLLALAATALAVQLGMAYFPQWRQLWIDPVHDRNAHLELGYGFASDLVHGRVGELIRDVDRARTWPPLHDGLMVATSILIGGMDVRLAVLPSLACYPLAALFAFLVTRRLVRSGTVAGLVAATLVLVSPAIRAYSTDVMLEGPGAALTLMALYAAVRATQDDTPATWRGLALSLSVLFFLKYNYWLLVGLALLAVNAPAIWFWGRQQWPDILRILCGVARKPIVYVVVVLWAGCLWARLTGRPTLNLTTLAYWALLAPIARWYWRSGRTLVQTRPRLNEFVNWHIIPIALWFCWPQKLACFLWVLNPGTNVGEFPAESRWEGFAFYARSAADDYHSSEWSAVLVAGLFLAACGLAALGRFRRGAMIVVAFALIAILVTAQHPNRKSRFLHSWLPATWVLAGAGIGAAARWRVSCAQPAAMVCGTALILSHLPALTAAPHAPEGGIQIHRPSALAITDAYLPALADAKRPAVLSTVPLKFLARWTYLDRYGRGQRVVTDVPANPASFAAWLDSTTCDAIVFVDLPPTSPWYVPVPGCAELTQYRECLQRQTVFPVRATYSLGDPNLGTVTLWTKPEP